MLTWGAEPETMDRTYIRVSYSSKFPSLLDRYYQSAFYSGNPDLKVERDWTFQTGLERQWRSDGQRFVFAPDGLFQWRRDAQVTSGYPTARNVGDSWLATARLRLEYQPDSLLEFGMNGARHSSRVVETGDPFPYQPRWTGLIYAEVHDDPIQERWMGRLYGRGATESMVTPGGADLPDAWVMGVKADWVLSRDFNNLDVRLSLDVDNIWARSIEWVRDYPSEGRVWTLGLEARF
jgi:outer membrane receptor protein involved in Fe transport